MTVHTPPPKLTPAKVDVSVGGSWAPTWTDRLPELAPIHRSIDTMKRAILAVARPAEEVRNLAPEHRPLRLEGLAKAGKSAIAGINRAEAEAEERLSKIFDQLHAESRRHLASPRNDVHIALGSMQIRERIAGQEHPGTYAHSLVEDLDVVQAVLGAPAAASGMRSKEHLDFWTAAEAKHLPHVFHGREAARGAMDELARSAKMARKMVAETTGLRETSTGFLAPWEEVTEK